MPPSIKWVLAGFGFTAAGFICTLKARRELDKEREAEIWQESVSELRESSSSQFSQPRSQFSQTDSESSTPSPGKSKNDG